MTGSCETRAGRSRDQLREWFADPPRAFRPKIRWTWPGVAVDEGELRSEIAEMVAAGFGAAEVSNMFAGLHPEGNPSETWAWGTDLWTERMAAAARFARELAFALDLTVGPAWPWASPVVSGQREHLGQLELVRVGPVSDPGAWSRAPDDVAAGILLAVTSARPIGERNGRIILDPRSLHVMASEELGRRRSGASRETLYFAFWQRPTGQGAKGPSLPDARYPLVIDHLRAEAVEAALAFIDQQLIRRLGELGSVFCELFEDSLELDHEGLLWTPDLLTEFRRRRGYDLRPYLPVVDRKDVATQPVEDDDVRQFDLPDASGERVRCDYHRTLTELWVQRHIQPMSRWTRARGMRARVQAYGQSFDVLAVSKAVDVPETEDLYSNSLDFWRTIASAAHLAGAPTVSMEHGAVIHADFMMTLEEVKRRADRAFCAGINQIVTHTYPYKDAAGMRWPAWTPWSSPHWGGGFSDAWNGANPQWTHLRPLTNYIARAQMLLRQGDPAMDVVVYRDMYGYPNAHGAGTTAPFGVDPPEPELNQALSEAGINFDFIDPGTLVDPDVAVANGRLVVREPGYGALVVDLESSRRSVIDNTKAMAGEVADRLATFAEQGLAIVVVGRFPERGVSYAEPETEDDQVRLAVVRLRAAPRARVVPSATQVPAALRVLGVSGAASFDRPTSILTVRRRGKDGDRWFLWNAGEERAEHVITFAVDGSMQPETWDLWTGVVDPLAHYRAQRGRIEVPVSLAPRESTMVVFRPGQLRHVTDLSSGRAYRRGDRLVVRSSGGRIVAATSDGVEATLEIAPVPDPLPVDRWHLHVEGIGPDGSDRHDLELSRLADWRDIPEIAHTSGLGIYVASVDVPSSWLEAGRVVDLRLGAIHGGVRIRVNGRQITPASVAPEALDVTPHLRPGSNTIEVEVSTTLKNRLDHAADRPEYAYLVHRPVRSQAYGLLGPVMLVPFAEIAVDSGR